MDNLRAIPIPLPSLATQQAIVAELEAEQALVTENKKLIGHMQNRIQATLGRVWGEKQHETFTGAPEFFQGERSEALVAEDSSSYGIISLTGKNEL